MIDCTHLSRLCFCLAAAFMLLAGPMGEAAMAQRARDGARHTAGDFDYYALVLSWSPTHCSEAQRGRDDLQCERRDGKRFAFVLHGLWPQYERGFPESCPTRGRVFVPKATIDGMLDIMPAPGLVIHEYRKHGTCSGLDPQRYYGLARQLYGRIFIPKQFVNPMEAQVIAIADVERAFLEANPALKPEMVSFACGGAGNRLREVRICFTKEGEPRGCGANEEQKRLCSAQKVYLPPVRSNK